MRSVAISALSPSASSFAHAISGLTIPNPACVPKPQSVSATNGIDVLAVLRLFDETEQFRRMGKAVDVCRENGE